VALVVSTDVLTLVAAASRRLNIREIVVGGVGATTSAIAMAVYRSTGGTTPGGALTPTKIPHTELPAAPAFTNFTTYAVAPTLSGDPLIILPFRDQGGNFIWRPSDYEQEIEARNSEQLSFRPIVVAGSVSFHFHVRED
jgi:hypothetical protein